MTATLRLIPLSREECRTRLERKGKRTSIDASGGALPDAAVGPADEFDVPRGPLTLKLCEAKHCNEVVEVGDGDYQAPEFMRYASRYQDGSIAAIVSLGRNHATGIKWNPVSRALCDVSLARCRKLSSKIGGDGGSGNEEVRVVDLATSPSTSSTEQIISHSQSPGPTDDPDRMAVAACMGMRKAAGEHSVFLDGNLVTKPLGREFPLRHGSIISLYGATGFAYEVEISQKDDKEKTDTDAAKNKVCAAASPKKRRSNPTAESPSKEKKRHPQRELRQRAHKLMIGEFTCAMCMDILVKSTFAYPCMHAFCEGCSRSISDAASDGTRDRTHKGTCPTCRGNVEGWGAARSFDTIVWAAALQGCFERDDAEYYLERREECGEDAPTALERACILNGAEEGPGGGTRKAHGGIYLPPSPSMQHPATNFIKTLPPIFPTATKGNSNNGNKSSLFARKPPPDLGKSVKDVICID